MFVAQEQVNWATVKADRQVPHPERQPRSCGDTASPGDATSADLDSAVVDAAIDAYSGTGKPYLQISGTWVYGANTSITEESPFHAPAMVAWKELIERQVLGAKDMRDVDRNVPSGPRSRDQLLRYRRRQWRRRVGENPRNAHLRLP